MLTKLVPRYHTAARECDRGVGPLSVMPWVGVSPRGPAAACETPNLSLKRLTGRFTPTSSPLYNPHSFFFPSYMQLHHARAPGASDDYLIQLHRPDTCDPSTLVTTIHTAQPSALFLLSTQIQTDDDQRILDAKAPFASTRRVALIER